MNTISNAMNKVSQTIFPGNTNNPNNPPKNGLGGIWSWNNNGVWTNFDPQASKQIDDQIRTQWKGMNNNIIVFPITKGPWFSQKRNSGVYFCNVTLNHSRTKIKGVMQQNIQTGFGRQMKRIPPFQLHPHNNNNNNHKNNNKNNSQYNNTNKHQSGGHNNNKNNSHSGHNNSNSNNNNNNNNKHKNYSKHNNKSYNTKSYNNNKNISGHNNKHISGHNNNNPYGYTPSNPSNQHFGTMTTGPQVNNDGSVCWSWQDDYSWKSYDNATNTQIENAYNAFQNSIVLNKGPYFGAPNRQGRYMIQFNRQSIPHSFTQVNTLTRFDRKVARTGGNNNQNNNNNNNQSNNNVNMNSNNNDNNDDNNNNDNESNNNNNNNNNSNDKHAQWRQYYKPMTIKHFKKLKDKDKLCNICFCEFDEKELFENECDEFKKQMQLDTEITEPKTQINQDKKDEKDNDGDTEITDSKINTNTNTNSNKDICNESNYNINCELLNKITDNTIIYLSKCCNTDHYFHSECISRWLNEKGKCSHCQKRYAIETGTQPLTGRLKTSFISYPCAGYKGYGTIKIIFEFDSGIQGKEHYHPGQHYYGDHREVYFPNNEQGREGLELTKIAFERRLIFSIGTSLTTKKENRIVWGSIHFKSRMEGGQQRHGYPDDTYFDRFKEELKAKGVTTNDIDQQGKFNIKNGYNNNNQYGNMYGQY